MDLQRTRVPRAPPVRVAVPPLAEQTRAHPTVDPIKMRGFRVQAVPTEDLRAATAAPASLQAHRMREPSRLATTLKRIKPAVAAVALRVAPPTTPSLG